MLPNELSITIGRLSLAALAENACRANNNENDRFLETMISVERKKKREGERVKKIKREKVWKCIKEGRMKERERK